MFYLKKKMFTEILPINVNEKIFLLNFLIDSNEILLKTISEELFNCESQFAMSIFTKDSLVFVEFQVYENIS